MRATDADTDTDVDADSDAVTFVGAAKLAYWAKEQPLARAAQHEHRRLPLRRGIKWTHSGDYIMLATSLLADILATKLNPACVGPGQRVYSRLTSLHVCSMRIFQKEIYRGARNNAFEHDTMALFIYRPQNVHLAGNPAKR